MENYQHTKKFKTNQSAQQRIILMKEIAKITVMNQCAHIPNRNIEQSTLSRVYPGALYAKLFTLK